MRWITCLLVLAFLVPAAHGWSNKEHMQLTRIAAQRLIADPATPPAMKDWLKRAVPQLLDADGERDFFLYRHVGHLGRGADGLCFWSIMPDLVTITERLEKVEPYGVNEGKLHFLDMEYFMPDEAKRSYADDLSHKPAIGDFPRDMSDARYQKSGMLPFAIERTYKLMVQSIREGRLDDKPGQYPRDNHAARWAGYLAHYLADNTQPHHGTIDYKSYSYFPAGTDPKKLPDVHGDFEYRLGDDDADDYMDLRKEMWAELSKAIEQAKDPITTDDLWKATIEVCLTSYGALPMLGRAGREAYPQLGPDGPGPWQPDRFFHYKGRFLDHEMSVMQLKAHQQAWAIVRIQRVWLAAWRDAAK